MKISKEFKIGIIVTAAIGLFIWGINFLKGSNLFSEKYELYAVYPKIDGLIEANPLLVNGFKVGQISKISLTQDKNGQYGVLVKFLLTEDVNIPKHSIARAVSSDLLGPKAVEVIYSGETEFVQSGDTLIAETEEGLKTAVSKQLQPLQKKIEGLLSSVDSVMTVVQVVLNDKTRENLSKSFESIKKAIQSLEQTAYKLDDLVASEKTKISAILTKLNTLAGMLEKNTGKIDNIIGNFSNLSDSLAKSNLKGAIDEADKTLAELNKLVAQINSGQGTLGKLVKNDSLYNNLNKASDDLDKLMKDLRINPERYIHLSVFGRKDKNKPKL
ncbi:MAG: MCE family protein [Bacteroidetes bacterium]|nr:MCE family protein [Bacteroidota bacterium]